MSNSDLQDSLVIYIVASYFHCEGSCTLQINLTISYKHARFCMHLATVTEDTQCCVDQFARQPQSSVKALHTCRCPTPQSYLAGIL